MKSNHSKITKALKWVVKKELAKLQKMKNKRIRKKLIREIKKVEVKNEKWERRNEKWEMRK